MKFEIYGPYQVPRIKYGTTRLITKDSVPLLQKIVDDDDLISGCGCYVFALRAGKGYTPWYVGQASKMRLLDESMNSHNREKFNKIISSHSGTPVIFYIPKLTKGGKFARPTTKASGDLKAVNFLEEWLIATALQKNQKLINQKQTYFLKYLHVVGLFNPTVGETTACSQEFKRAIF